MEERDLVKELGIKDGYSNVKLNDKFYLLRRPTAIEEIDMQDNNITIEGEIDLFGYIKDILKFVSPKMDMEDIVIKKDNKIVVGDKTLTFDKLSAEEGLKILLRTQKVGLNSDGKKVAKINQGETIRRIIECCDEHENVKIDDFKTKSELNELFEKFSDLIDINGAMMLFETFQKSVQD